ncbi:MAG: glycosyltransferase [Paraglaciecola sp.]|uniref:glycosyltransferase n=1 Tax=Paraglaciecola sp. TaxID=1920173 RepID=UPI00329909F7
MNNLPSSKKINIAHITYDMRIGGTEMVIKNIIEGSDAELFEMSIFCIEKPLGPWGVELKNAGLSISTKERKPGFDLSMLFSIRKHLHNNQIDIIHCHQYTPWVYGVLAAIGTKTKVIFTEHGRFYPDFSSWKRKYINPILVKITNHITAISSATKDALINYEFIPRKKIEVIYNGIKPLLIASEQVSKIKNELDIADEKFVFGTIARLDPIKNHIMMLKAFKLVKNQYDNAVLIIVGDGEEKENIIATIKSLELENDVILTGYKTDPSPYLEIFDTYLLSSFSEGTSMTLLEAMSIGKPCVVTDAGGNKEIIVDNKNGFVTPNNDAEAFSQSMLDLINTPELRKEMSRYSFERFNHYFSADIMNKSYKALYMAHTKC